MNARRRVSELITAFMSRVDHGDDLEKQLNFLVECRANFHNLFPVIETLVCSMNRLTIAAVRGPPRRATTHLVKRGMTARLQAFAHACIACAFITIPSLRSVPARMRLYLLTGQCALQASCLGQAEACLKEAVKLVLEMPPQVMGSDGKFRSSEPLLMALIRQLFSALLLFPDNPDKAESAGSLGQPLPLLTGLLNAVDKRDCWEPNGHAKSLLFCEALALLSAMGQERYAYRAAGVDGNDVIYGSLESFRDHLNGMASVLLTKVAFDAEYGAGTGSGPAGNGQVACAAVNLLLGHADFGGCP